MTDQEDQRFKKISQEDFLKILKEGKEVWNAFRKNYSKITLQNIDLSNIDFSYYNLLGLDCNNCNFSNAVFHSCSLNDTRFIKSNLTGAKISGSGVTNIDFSDSDLSRSTLQGNFKRSVFKKVIFLNTLLDDCNFSHANFSDASIRESSIRNSKFYMSDFSRVQLTKVKAEGINFSYANFSHANFEEGDFSNSKFSGADLSNTTFTNSLLDEVLFYQTNLTGTNFSNCSLQRAVFVEGKVNNCLLTNCWIYGLSAWALQGHFKDQSRLIITPRNREGGEITIDNLAMAQFIFLLLNNRNIRTVIDTVTSKAVLILGRFTTERKEILDALRVELNKFNYVPILFDFENSKNQTLLETIMTLAGMARFIIADITIATMVREELRTIVEKYPSKPIKPILLESEKAYVSLPDILTGFKSVLPIYYYKNKASVLSNINEQIIVPAERWLELKNDYFTEDRKTQREIDLENQLKILQEALERKNL